ncbi:MAG: hypothetical protein KDA58_05355 [Planctomycetaceae bacterium]|nr:hypothetical protein [Planctomycetaceae bacterium]
MSSDQPPTLNLLSTQDLIRRRLARLIGVMVAYFLLSTVLLGLVGPPSHTWISAFRLLFYAVSVLVMGIMMPRRQAVLKTDEPHFEISGIWPEHWTPRPSLRTSLISAVAAGAVIGWLLLESVLLSTERSSIIGSANAMVELFIGLDLAIVWASIPICLWISWEPFVTRSPMLLVHDDGLYLQDYPDRRTPTWIIWSDLRRASISLEKAALLYLWYRPSRHVIGIKLPRLRQVELNALESFISEKCGVAPSPPRPVIAEPERRFDQLLDRLGKKRPEDLGLLAPTTPAPQPKPQTAPAPSQADDLEFLDDLPAADAGLEFLDDPPTIDPAH